MAVTKSNVHLGGLARKLVNDGLLEQETAQQAHQDALKEKMPLVSYLVTNDIVPGDKIARAASQEFGIPLIDIENVEIDPDVTKLVKENLVQKHHALPLFKRGKRLYLGVSDPTNLLALDEIKFAVSMNTEAILVEENKLAKAIESALEDADGGLGDMAEDDFDDLDDLELADDSADKGEDDDTDIDDAPVVRFVNKVLLDAIKKGGSDLHFEPYEKFYRVRFRIDGVLEEVAKPPLALTRKIAARIKVMSRMDVSERRVPQDGRIKLKISKTKSIDFRVSTCPTLFGEKVVMRILDPMALMVDLTKLGFREEDLNKFNEKIHLPYGIILVTGPT
ncbi:MAG: Flp pilus assembly complex ATPase component TadA, partial [Gammaproteobacteria bacterium]|nr:Flp pilus assembly complex ATPase component TadA [Gammaproteobacteria bacterium]